MANPFQGDDVDPFSGARDEEGNIAREPAAAAAAPEKKMTFGEAFKAARGRGDKTFEYMGKKFTTEMAGGKKSAGTTSAKTDSDKPKSTTYADAAKSSRSLGDLMNESTQSREDLKEAVRSGKEKTLGTKLQEFGGRFKRALMTGRPQGEGMKKGGKVKKYASGGSVSSASKRADGCAQRGKTKGRMV